MQVTGSGAFLLGCLGDPLCDRGRVGALVECLAVLGELLASVLEPFTRVLSGRVVVGVGVGCDDEPCGLLRSFGREEFLEPRVEGLDQRVLAYVDVRGGGRGW